MPTSSPASLRHRRSFWFGLGTLILLTAAWVQSIGQITAISWDNSRHPTVVTHTNGNIAFYITEKNLYRSAHHHTGGITIDVNQPVRTRRIMPPAQIDRTNYGAFISSAIYIPYWLIITLFLLTWIPFLIWRTHTIRKHLNQIAHLTNP